MVLLVNLGEETHRIAPGDRVAQLVIVPVATVDAALVDELPESDGRGAGGFGSTGR
jgi:dUTP pyrophosphatase